MAKVDAPKQAPATDKNAPKSAAPGTKDEAGKKEKVKRVMHPALFNEKGDRVRLKEIPADFDAKKHKPIQRKDLEDEGLWFELKAKEMDAKAAKFRELAAECRAAGSSTERQKAKKLIAMQKKITELSAALLAAGMPQEKINEMLKLGASAVTETK